MLGHGMLRYFIGVLHCWAKNIKSKPADLAILKSLPTDSTHVEKEIVEVFSQKDDYLSDFEFTPIHIAVLELYDPKDSDRPSLTQ